MNSNIGTRKRASRHIRPENLKRMRLTERDKLVVKAVNDFRVMRQDQVQRLFFPSKNTTQVRLQLLWQHGFLKRYFPPVLGGVQTSTIYYLVDRRGVELLKQEFGYSGDHSRYSSKKSLNDRFLEHTLGLSEIRLAVELSCQQHSLRLQEWQDEKAMKADYDRVQVQNKFVPILPDSYFSIDVPGGVLRFFLEFDRGSEQLKYFKRKIAAYWNYFRSGKCKARYGTNLIRVLTVTEGGYTRTSRKRLNSVQKVTKELGANTWFWFTSLEQIQSEDFLTAPIWQLVEGQERMSLFEVSN